MRDSKSIEDNLEMRSSRRNRGPMVVVMVDKSSKSTLFDSGGQSVDGNEQVGGNGVPIEEPCKRAVNNDIVVERFGEDRRYPMREWRPLKDW